VTFAQHVGAYVKRRWWYLLGLMLIPCAILGPGWVEYQLWLREKSFRASCEAEELQIRQTLLHAAQCQKDSDCVYLTCVAPDWCRFLVNSSVQLEPIQTALAIHFARCETRPWSQACPVEEPLRCHCGQCSGAALTCVWE
jgi:hypothetical protein